ncbi:MAG: YkvA family protein [Clostridiaceae bacterium]
MKISKVTTILTKEDILSIIDEFVEVEGLIINDIEIDKSIRIKGSYKFKLNINFYLDLGISNIHENKLYLKIFKIKVNKIGIISPITNLALKTITKKLKDYGLFFENKFLIIDLEILSENIPYVYFKLNSIKLLKDSLEVDVEEIVYTEEKEKAEEKKEKLKKVNTKDDYYGNFRRTIDGKIPEKYKKIYELSIMVPDIIDLFWRLLKDKRVPIKNKALIAATASYLVLPIDIIPDYIPFVGKIDDIALSFFALNKILQEVSNDIIVDNYQGDEDLVLKVKDGIGIISDLVGGKNVSKVYNFIADSIKKKDKDEAEEQGE